MAKYTGADCRMCRREGAKLFLKGEKCYKRGTCPFEKRSVAPGQHGAARKKTTEYCAQLREKQKAKRIYGLQEGQFRKYYEMAEKTKGITGEVMLQLIERRLDNVIYRMGLGCSRSQARQIVNHAHITVNGKCINIPSYIVKVGDVIAIKAGKEKSPLYKDLKSKAVPKWLDFDVKKLSGKILSMPQREDVDMDIAEHMIVELYSR